MSVTGAPSAGGTVRSLATGVGLAVLGFAMFTGMDTLVKWLSGDYPLHQVVFFNALFSLLPALASILYGGSLRMLASPRWKLHLLRSLFACAGTFGGFFAFSRMPLADAYAILFAAPLLITALSVPVLGEQVGWRRWSAVAVGFLGVLIMLRPGAGLIGPGAVGALIGAGCFACSVLIVRMLSATEHPAAILIFGNSTILLVAGLLTVGDFVAPHPADLALMTACGLFGGTAFICIVHAYRRAPAAIVAPFQYTQMIWGVVIGYVIWGDLPVPSVVLGGLVVAASGLFILHRETRLARAGARAAPEREPSLQPASLAPTQTLAAQAPLAGEMSAAAEPIPVAREP